MDLPKLYHIQCCSIAPLRKRVNPAGRYKIAREAAFIPLLRSRIIVPTDVRGLSTKSNGHARFSSRAGVGFPQFMVAAVMVSHQRCHPLQLLVRLRRCECP
jgi:hypothetical protein